METIIFSDCPELIKPNLRMKDIKRIIKDKTGIDEENQRFHVYFNFLNFYGWESNDERTFWDDLKMNIYDKTRYYAKITKKFYETDIMLDLNKRVKELKQLIFEQKNININNLEFSCGNDLLGDNETLDNYNLFQNELHIKIIKKFNDTINIKYPDFEIKEIKTDLCNNGLELLEEIGGIENIMKPGFNVKYDLYHNNEKIPLDDILINAGIKSGDILELRKRNTYQVLLLTYPGNTRKTYGFNVSLSDTIRLYKIFIYYKIGMPPDKQRLVFNGKQLEDNKTFADYCIMKDSTISLSFRFFG